MRSRIFAIKVDVRDSYSKTFAFKAQKMMYRGRHIAKGDTIFAFTSENAGGTGLIASGGVPLAKEAASFLRGFFRRGVFRQWEQKR